MLRIWRYFQLASGAIGTALAGLTALSFLLDASRFLGLPAIVLALFVVAMASGLSQWIVFQRRHFDRAAWMFAVTLVAWCLACAVHVIYFLPDCSNGCTLVVIAPPK